MTGSRKITSRHFFPKLLALALALMFLAHGANTSQAAGKTVFLPLKVSSPGEQAALESASDKALQRALEDSSIQMTPRPDALNLVEYGASWPPPATVLKGLATKIGSENLVTGQITAIGNKLSVDIKLFDLLRSTSPKPPRVKR